MEIVINLFEWSTSVPTRPASPDSIIGQFEYLTHDRSYVAAND